MQEKTRIDNSMLELEVSQINSFKRMIYFDMFKMNEGMKQMRNQAETEQPLLRRNSDLVGGMHKCATQKNINFSSINKKLRLPPKGELKKGSRYSLRSKYRTQSVY